MTAQYSRVLEWRWLPRSCEGHNRTNVFCESAAAGAGPHFDAVVAQSARSEGSRFEVPRPVARTSCDTWKVDYGRRFQTRFSAAGGRGVRGADVHDCQRHHARRQPARVADWQPDVAASRPDWNGRLRWPRGGAQGHEGDRHRERGARVAERRVPGTHRRQTGPEDPRRQRNQEPQRALPWCPDQPARRPSNGRTTSA